MSFKDHSSLTTQHTSQGREVITIPIDEGIISLRGLSPKRLRFEIEYGLERGSTANTFLIMPSEGFSGKYHPAVLIHPPGEAYKDVFLEALKKNLSTSHTKLWIIISHVNPNRIGLLKAIADIYRQTKLICSSPGAKLIQELWNQEKPSKNSNESAISRGPKIPEIQIIKQQETIFINNQFQLLLIPAPTARWPGGLLAFEENLGLLMSGKFFAAHICSKNWAELHRVNTEEDRRYYFDCLMASMSNQVNGVIEQLEELNIRTIAPGHGPAIDGSWRSLLNDYQRWGDNQKESNLNILLLYASAYGNTAAIADALANGISRTGVKIESLNCEFIEPKQLVEAIHKADAYLIGSPTLGGHVPTPIVSALGTLLAEGAKEKPVGIFGSYGWSGEALDILEQKLRDGGFKFGFEAIKVKFSPDQLMIKKIEEIGTDFGRNLIKTKNNKNRRATSGMSTSRSDPSVIALGRIVGSLCVLMTQKGEGERMLNGAMVASWISQASFNPPGLSIAVAKDRAVESLLHSGDMFTLNVLAEGRHQAIMRYFLKPFPPGANRFSGLIMGESSSGLPILPDALAWLEGCIQNRMECGDHWLIYAEIVNGKVLDSEGVTAVHHRRTGANY